MYIDLVTIILLCPSLIWRVSKVHLVFLIEWISFPVTLPAKQLFFRKLSSKQLTKSNVKSKCKNKIRIYTKCSITYRKNRSSSAPLKDKQKRKVKRPGDGDTHACLGREFTKREPPLRRPVLVLLPSGPPLEAAHRLGLQLINEGYWLMWGEPILGVLGSWVA